MFIESISLYNIRSYIEQTIDFRSGSTLLWGEIGSGKSTILYSIEFALFGIIKGINSYDQLLRHGETEGKVTLVLRMGLDGQQNERRYTIERIIKRSAKGRFTTASSVSVDGVRRELSTSELRYFIHELLGYPTEDVSRKFMLFRYSVYTPQEEMKQILLDDPDSRIATLRKIFDLDRYKHIADNVTFYTRYLNAQIRYQEGKKEGLLEREEEVKTLDETYQKNSVRLVELQDTRTLYQKEIETRRGQLERDEKKVEQRRTLTEQLSVLKTRLLHFQSTYTELLTTEKEHTKVLDERIDETVSLLKKVHSSVPETLQITHPNDYRNIQSLLQEVSKISSHLLQAKDFQDLDGPLSLHESFTQAKDKTLELTSFVEHLINRLVQDQQEIRKRHEEHQKAIYEAQAKCTTCSSTIQTVDDAIASLKKRYIDDVTSEKRDQIQEQSEQITQSIEATNHDHDQNRRRREAVSKTIHTYESKMSAAQDIIETIGKLNECPTCLQPVSENYKEQVITTQHEIIRLSQETFSQMKLSVQQMTEEERRLATKLDSLQKEQITVSTRLQQIQKILEDNAAVTKEITAAREKRNEAEQEQQRATAVLKALTQREEQETAVTQQQIEQVKIALETIASSLRDLKYVLSVCLDHVEALQKNTVSIQETKSKKEELSTQVNRCQSAIDECTIDPDSIPEQKRLLEEYREKLNALQISITEVTKDQSYIAQETKKLRSEIEEKKRAKAEYTFLQSVHGWLTEYFLKLTQVIERHVFMTIYQEFNESFRKWFDVLIDSEEISVQLDSQFTPLITINGYDAEYQHLSGGEKTATALAYRIALNEILHRTFSSITTRDLIILDEPTDGFSYQQIDKIQDLLERIHCSQIIIVSHETKIESYVDNMVRIRKENHASVIE